MVRAIIILFLSAGYLFLSVCNAQADTVDVCAWKDCRQAALSISADDTCASCSLALMRNNFKGTFFIYRPASRKHRFLGYLSMFILSRMGHEMGTHTIHHINRQVSRDYMEQEFIDSINEVNKKIGVSPRKIISLSWPGGYIQHKDVAREYFLYARGYNINELEDTTPKDFMNLKSFNSHGQKPHSPSDLKTVVERAQKEGKWAILVFHGQCDDNGAIDYAKNRDIWVAPIGTVIKYIIQRNNLRVTDVTETPSQIRFTVSRPKIPPTRIRNFEAAFNPDDDDEITLKIDIDDMYNIKSVNMDRKKMPYKIETEDKNKYLLLSAHIPSKGKRIIEVEYE